jgi:RimJ/RimL family protein N-acetyltransferase
MPWPAPFLTTPHLTIRPYHPSDAAELARIANNKFISCNMTNRFPSPYTVADAHIWLTKALNPKESGVYAWTISLAPTGPPIGGCGLEPGSDIHCRNAEIGYWLGEEYWGNGYGSELCAALTRWAFEQPKGVSGEGESLLRIGAGVYGGNVGSGRVLRRCGYRLEGTMRGIVWKWGERRDLEVYGLLREEWEELQRLNIKKGE